MTTKFSPPPTYTDPVIINETTKRMQFNPLWLKWFLDIAYFVSQSGGGTGGAVQHNSTAGIQGGVEGEAYHLTLGQRNDLTDGGDTSAHYHSADRNRANHTGTQELSSISDVTVTADKINELSNGLTVTIVTAKLTVDGTEGSMTFTNGILTAQTAAT